MQLAGYCIGLRYLDKLTRPTQDLSRLKLVVQIILGTLKLIVHLLKEAVNIARNIIYELHSNVVTPFVPQVLSYSPLSETIFSPDANHALHHSHWHTWHQHYK